MNAAALALLGAIWGSSFLFMRVAAPAFGAPALIALRLGLAALLLAAVAFATRRTIPLAARWRHYLVLGAINSAIPFLLFAYAARTLPASLLSLFNSLAPIWGAVIGAVWLGAAASRRTVAGLVCGVGGVAVIAGQHVLAVRDTSTQTLALAVTAAAGAPVLYGFAACYLKRHALGDQPFTTALGSVAAATLLAAPLGVAGAPEVPPSANEWAAAATLGVLCTGVAYLLSFKLVAVLGPTRALAVTFLVPVFGVLWGRVFLGEAVGATLILGAALVLLAMYLAVIPARASSLATPDSSPGTASSSRRDPWSR